MMLPSFSNWNRLLVCAHEPALPRAPQLQRETRHGRGTAVHWLVENPGERAEACRRWPEHAAFLSAVSAKSLDRLVKQRMHREEARTWNALTGQGSRAMGVAGPIVDRRYHEIDNQHHYAIPGTLDGWSLDAGVLTVQDVKTGTGHPARPKLNAQVWLGALSLVDDPSIGPLVNTVVLQHAELNERGEVWFVNDEVSFPWLEERAGEVRAVVSRIMGRDTTPVVHAGCAYCPGRLACAAYAQAPSKDTLAAMSRADLFTRWRAMQSAADDAEKLLKASAEPVDAGNGKEWGRIPERRRSVDMAVAVRVIGERVGTEEALRCVNTKVTVQSLKKALGDRWGEMEAALDEAGAFSYTENTKWVVHKKGAAAVDASEEE